MKILVLAEHHQGHLNPVTLKLISAATQLGSDVTLLLAGLNIRPMAESCRTILGVQTVIFVDDPAYQFPIAQNYAALVAHLARDFTHILAPADTFGKDVLPRAAALCDAALISDVTKIIDKNTYVRPIYAGNAFATVQTEEPHQFITIRGTAFDLAQAEGGRAELMVKANPIEPTTQVRFVEAKLTVTSRPELTNAKIVVSGGRGLQNKENFKLIEQLADKLNAAVGASRAAVDAGFVPNDYQVGQTGKVVAPDLYIAVGISGAIQHLAGMKDSKVIVAINKDPDAPIFKVATYGLVGDLFTLVPELVENL